MHDTVRAWKDPAYRASLSDAERRGLSDNPAGIVEVPETAMDLVAGGAESSVPSWGGTCAVFTFGCCGPYPPPEELR